MDQKGDWWHIDRSDFVRDYCIDSSLPSLESQRKDCWNRCGGACCDTHCFFRSEKTDMSAARRANGISDNSRTNLDHRDISPVGPEEQLNSDSDCIDFIMEINKNYSNESHCPSIRTTGQPLLEEAANCPVELRAYARTRGRMQEMALQQKLITEQDPKGDGLLRLSAEEKRALLQDGFKLPTLLPLTKSEEDALKLSAQESRRKRKKYVNALEKRIQYYRTENSMLKSKLKDSEQRSRSSFVQFKNFQATVEPTSGREDHP